MDYIFNSYKFCMSISAGKSIMIKLTTISLTYQHSKRYTGGIHTDTTHHEERPSLWDTIGQYNTDTT
jgi:hypothetical protein